MKGRKCAFVKGGLLNGYLGKEIGLKVKDLKTPCKRSSGRKKMDAEVVVVEESSRSLRQLRIERLNDPIQLSRETRCVRVVLHGRKDVAIAMTQCTG
eukprot:6841148-Ditylum_brightwellii.AAC.2